MWGGGMLSVCNCYCDVRIDCVILQSTGTYDDLDSLRETLVDQNIILNVFSTYAKLSSKRVIGVDWQEQVISRVNNLQDTKNLPQVKHHTGRYPLGFSCNFCIDMSEWLVEIFAIFLSTLLHHKN